MATHGIGEANAAELSVVFATFEDWKSTEMDIYNDYDVVKARLQTR